MQKQRGVYPFEGDIFLICRNFGIVITHFGSERTVFPDSIDDFKACVTCGLGGWGQEVEAFKLLFIQYQNVDSSLMIFPTQCIQFCSVAELVFHST